MLAALLVSGLLCLAIGLVFGQTIHHEFLNFDDNVYVTGNPVVNQGITAGGVSAAFADHPYYHWQPLAVLSHMLDCQVYGLDAGAHHITSVALHAAAVVGLFLLLARMTGDLWPSALVAALFAVHPLRAESVAWVAERKDVLCGVCFILAIAAYVGYVRKRTWRRYLLVMAAFGLGLMAKPMLVTLPVILLLLDYWPLARWGWTPGQSIGENNANGRRLAVRDLLTEKIPLAIVAAAACVMTYKTHGPQIQSAEHYPLSLRIENALVSYVAYLGKFFYPVGLRPYYEHPGSELPAGQVLGAALLLAAITAVAVMARKRCPYLLVGWLWYGVMLLPVSQLVQLSKYGMADRYTYLPQIGIAVALVWGAAAISRSAIFQRAAAPGAEPAVRPSLQWLCGIAVVGGIGGLMWAAHREVAYWRDSQTLWTHALQVDPKNSLAHNNLGSILLAKGRFAEAEEHCESALAAQPDYLDAHKNLARR